MQNIHLTVAAVIERNKRFLMVEENVHSRKVINQPAGHVEPGESLLAAVIRETQEETAWVFSPAAINGVYLWRQPESGERFLRVVFCGSCSNHNPEQTLDDGILRTLWLSQAELMLHRNKLRSPMVLRAIDDFRAKIRFPMNMFQQLDLEDLAARAKVV